MRSIASWRWSLGLVAVLAMTGCDATSPTHSPAPPPAAPCPATARLDATGTVERQGAGDGATLWALFFPVQEMVTAGQELKVAWRMTGSGDFSVSADGPDGTVVRPVWGPEAHTGSNWARPGDEWGTGWVFPTAGCWTVNARRTSGSGYLVLRVAE